MFSSEFPHRPKQYYKNNYTTASTLRKPKSFYFKLLFGQYCEKRIKHKYERDNIVEPIDYVFTPNMLFGFSFSSSGHEYKKLHQCFVLRSCSPGEVGHIVPGIRPGAEILLWSNGATLCKRFLDILEKLKQQSIALSSLSPEYYRHFHRLLDAKLNTEYFLNEIINEHKNKIF